MNRYEREYFVSGDGRVRATIDTRQRAYDQRYGAAEHVVRGHHANEHLGHHGNVGQ